MERLHTKYERETRSIAQFFLLSFLAANIAANAQALTATDKKSTTIQRSQTAQNPTIQRSQKADFAAAQSPTKTPTASLTKQAIKPLAPTALKSPPMAAPAPSKILLVPAPALTAKPLNSALKPTQPQPTNTPSKEASDALSDSLLILNNESAAIAANLTKAAKALAANPDSSEAKKAVARYEADSRSIQREISALSGKKTPYQNEPKNKPNNALYIAKNTVESAASQGVQIEEKKHFEAWDVFQNYGVQKEIQNEVKQ